MKKSIDFIKSLNINNEEMVVLACSYGPDSMCLLDLLRKCNINVIVAHVNHKLRVESDEEYKLLEEYCNVNNIIFEGSVINEEPVGNREEYYRNYRYNFFKQIVRKYHSNYLFTAHHGDDLIETVIMRLLRGSSLKGYAGFNVKTQLEGYTLIRPLIYLSKDDIIKYNKDNNIPYAIDNTNFSNIYTRNKIRNEILPILKEINPKIHEKFIKYNYTLNTYNDYVEDEINNIYSNIYHNNSIDLNDFNLLPLFIKRNLLKKILLDIYESNINLINDNHVDLILDIIYNDKPNLMINLPNNVIVIKYYNMLEFTNNKVINDYCYQLDDYVKVDNFMIEIVDDSNLIKSNYLIRLNSKDIKLPLYIRNRKVGDKIILKNGTKKIGEILSESKVPKFERDRYPLLVDSNNKILWVPGLKKSKFDIEINKEYDIIIKCIKKERNYEEEK